MMKREADMCNGWTNYQTWTISLWYGDVFAEMGEEGQLNAEYIQEMVEEMEFSKIPESSLAADILNDFMRKVYWDELCDHYQVEEEEEYDGMGHALDGTGAY